MKQQRTTANSNQAWLQHFKSVHLAIVFGYLATICTIICRTQEKSIYTNQKEIKPENEMGITFVTLGKLLSKATKEEKKLKQIEKQK